MPKSDVLVVGAGPTGLILSLWLARAGVRVRVVDKAPEAGTTSRAVGVQARTLELYRAMGLDQALVDGGLPAVAANFWARGKKEGRLAFGEMGQGISPFPYMLVYPQDEHERLLAGRLEDAGVRVERPAEVIAVRDEGERVIARIRRADGSIDEHESAYVAGCDGARSTVRQAIGVEYPGGTYAHLFYVADVDATGPAMDGELHVALDESDFMACFPLQGRTRARLIGTVRSEIENAVIASRRDGAAERALDFDDVSKEILDRMKIAVTHVRWFSTYRVHHRVASSFRVGRAFLLGDAAHVHSPVGGQGMNTGIGDAINLAWKLADTVQGRAPASILDSYEAERVPFARRLVRTTDRIFEVVSSEGRLAHRVRLDVVPRVLPLVLRSARARRWMFKTISQTEIHYRPSPLSEGTAGRVRGGDRLPWIVGADGTGNGTDNFAPLRSLDWQVHVYGEPAAALTSACMSRGLPVHVFPWGAPAERAGVVRDAVFLLRPDGYVALAAHGDTASAQLARYLDERSLQPGKAARPRDDRPTGPSGGTPDTSRR